MAMRRKKLSEQVEEKVTKTIRKKQEEPEYDGSDITVSTGSTLLDLAITGGRFREGGVPLGILVEIFGPSGVGKTVLLCQLAANIQKLGGEVKFYDPEARLNKQFARMFGLEVREDDYDIPDTVTQIFDGIRDWMKKEEKNDILRGIFADSLAALSTEMEMTEGDKMGMRRAKEFSQELRKTCRIIKQKNLLMACSNQVRKNLDAGPYGAKYTTPGGEAIGFYSSLRLRCFSSERIKVKKKIRRKEQERVIGVRTEVEVFKSSVWKPFRRADVYILFDYGIDDVRGNLRYVKTVTGDTVYRIGDTKLSKSLNESILIVEEDGLEQELKEEVINLWNEVEEHFKEERKPRR